MFQEFFQKSRAIIVFVQVQKTQATSFIRSLKMTFLFFRFGCFPCFVFLSKQADVARSFAELQNVVSQLLPWLSEAENDSWFGGIFSAGTLGPVF